MNKLAKEFAENLYDQRVIKNISQEKLSIECGFDKNYIGLIERAKRRITLEKVYIIAAHLDCSINDLLPVEDARSIDEKIKVQ